MEDLDKIPKQKSGALTGSLICFMLGCFFMLITAWSFILYGMLFFISFILAIVAIAQDKVWPGIGMILANLIVPWIILGISVVIGLNNYDHEVEKVLSETSVPANDAKKINYLEYVDLYSIEVKEYNTFMDGKIPGLRFKLKNVSDSVLFGVSVKAYFLDSEGKAIAEKEYNPVLITEWNLDNEAPLKPNYIWEHEKDQFYSLKDLPSEWDFGSVELEISDIDFK